MLFPSGRDVTLYPPRIELRIDAMRRREFITLLRGPAAGGPMAARAQQDGRIRRTGLLLLGFPGAAGLFEVQLSTVGSII